MDIYERLGIKRYINAHDTYTMYGGSRMAQNTMEAMKQIAASFVDIDELQHNLGDRIAHMTHNEGAYITNGASGGLLLAAVICMARDNIFSFSRLPEIIAGVKSEIIVMRGQRNAYDKAIESSGAKIVEIGDADKTLEWELEGAINDKTAAIFYFASSLYAKSSLSLKKTIKIAKQKGVPVVVDAAAQLPPVENLWNFTRMGADMTIFSGGKTLCGPQPSGLIVGKKSWIELCRKYGAPAHGICRSSKVGREEMVGIYIAIENYMSLDHTIWIQSLERMVNYMMKEMESTGAFKTECLTYGPVGQNYPRALGRIIAPFKAEELADLMRRHDPGIYIGIDRDEDNAIYLSPLNINNDELDVVLAALKECVNVLLHKQNSNC
jgi:L-seryl-tRNA(Ser) seleniumtransferase